MSTAVCVQARSNFEVTNRPWRHFRLEFRRFLRAQASAIQQMYTRMLARSLPRKKIKYRLRCR